MAPFCLVWIQDLVVAAAGAAVDICPLARLVADRVLDGPEVILVHAMPNMDDGTVGMVGVEERHAECMPDAHGLLTTYHAHDQ